MLTMDAVRAHIKADDGDDDAVLSIYARAAIQAAEMHTGMRLSPGNVSDVVKEPYGNTFRLSSEPTGPVVAVITVNGQEQRYSVPASGKTVRLPFSVAPCGVGVEFRYRVGPADSECGGLVDTDPMIELGILKFIAHAWTNRGDGANAWATDSGASELWSSFRPVFWG
jgi:hypothetical protein